MSRMVSTAPSCPPPDLAPAVSVNNLSPLVDPDHPPDSVVARMSTVERTLTLGQSLDRAVELLEESLRDASSQPALQVRILCRLAWTVRFKPGFVEALEHARAALRLADDLGGQLNARRCAEIRAEAGREVGQWRETISRAEQARKDRISRLARIL